MNFTYRGLIAPVFTPFKDNMSINIDIISKYADFLCKSGITGILVNGTTGEGPSLSTSERKALTEAWKTAITSTKQHLMVQIGGAPLPDVLEMAKHAEQIKVDSILCLPELYFKPKTTSELISYLQEVGRAAPNTPLLYYHIPSFSNVNIHMGDLMNEINGNIPTFCGIKFTSTSLDEGLIALNSSKGKYSVFLGADNVLAGAFTLGYNSAIMTTLNFIPQLSFDIQNAIKNSDLQRARQQQMKLNAYISIITQKGGWVPTMKEAMNILSPIKVGKVRNPLNTINETDVEKMREKLQALGF